MGTGGPGIAVAFLSLCACLIKEWTKQTYWINLNKMKWYVIARACLRTEGAVSEQAVLAVPWQPGQLHGPLEWRGNNSLKCTSCSWHVFPCCESCACHQPMFHNESTLRVKEQRAICPFVTCVFWRKVKSEGEMGLLPLRTHFHTTSLNYSSDTTLGLLA